MSSATCLHGWGEEVRVRGGDGRGGKGERCVGEGQPALPEEGAGGGKEVRVRGEGGEWGTSGRAGDVCGGEGATCLA